MMFTICTFVKMVEQIDREKRKMPTGMPTRRPSKNLNQGLACWYVLKPQ